MSKPVRSGGGRDRERGGRDGRERGGRDDRERGGRVDRARGGRDDGDREGRDDRSRDRGRNGDRYKTKIVLHIKCMLNISLPGPGPDQGGRVGQSQGARTERGGGRETKKH